MRAPFLAIGGNSMYSMLYDANFTYDSSMPIYEELYNSCNNTDSMRAKLFFSSFVVVTLPALFIVLFIYFNGILGFTAGSNATQLKQNKAMRDQFRGTVNRRTIQCGVGLSFVTKLQLLYNQTFRTNLHPSPTPSTTRSSTTA